MHRSPHKEGPGRLESGIARPGRWLITCGLVDGEANKAVKPFATLPARKSIRKKA